MGDIPTIHITNEGEESDYLAKHRFEIHSRILEGVERGVNEGIDNILLFKIINHVDNYTVILSVTKESWGESLEKCKNYFQQVEEYEACERVRILEEKNKNGDI